ncbi:MAG: hypothetical protein AAF531_14020 [Actinomycetota bacterium]
MRIPIRSQSRRTSTIGAVAVTLVLVMTVAACADQRDEQDQVAFEDILAQANQFAPPAQRPALADGVITFDEYEAAVFATVDCLEENGAAVVSGPTLEANHRYDWETQGYPDDPERDDEVVGIIFRCMDEHLSYIDSIFFYEEPLSEVEERRRFNEFIECAQDITGLDHGSVSVEEGPGVVLQQTFDAGIDTTKLEGCLAEHGYL